MVLGKKYKILIKSSYETKGYGVHKLLKQFPQINWTKGGFDNRQQLDYKAEKY